MGIVLKATKLRPEDIREALLAMDRSLEAQLPSMMQSRGPSGMRSVRVQMRSTPGTANE